MSTHLISRFRDRADKVTLLALGVVFTQLLPPESSPLTHEGERQIIERIERLEFRTPLAIQALEAMDPTVFEHAPEAVNNPAKVAKFLQGMPSEMKQMFWDGRIRTLPADYLFEDRGVLAQTQGAITPWKGDEVILVPWDEQRAIIPVAPGQSFEASFAHEYAHARLGPHSVGYMWDATLSKETVAESDWARLAREHGDIPYMLSDTYWFLDQWAQGGSTITGEPMYAEVAHVYGIDGQEAQTLAHAAVELSEREREWHVRREISDEGIASRR